MGLILSLPFHPSIISITNQDVRDVEVLLEESEGMRHTGCGVFQRNIEKVKIGKWLRVNEVSDMDNTFMQLVVRRKDFLPK